jgi:hypothetical protein
MTQVELTVETLAACPVCGSGKFTTAPKQGLSSLLEYSRCKKCHTLFLNPRMTDEQTALYYSGMYRDLLGGGEDGTKPTDLALQQKRARYQVIISREHIKGAESHLEIGCSAGYLLDAVGLLDSIGVEPDTRFHKLTPARKFALAADIRQVPARTFDLISLSHVLEHINHPTDYLRYLIEHHAHERTRFLIEVPNAEATIEAYLIHHPIAYTIQTLMGQFAEVGYRAVDVWAHGLGAHVPKFLLGVFEKGGK